MAFYPESYWLYATMAGSSIDITPYTMPDDIEVEWGIEGNESTDLLADTGEMSFVLNNRDNLFTPGHTNVLEGWIKGIPIELVITYEGETFKRFRGTLEDLKYNDEDRTVACTVLDWIDESASYPLTLLTSDTDKTGDEALNILLAGMPIQPQNTNFDTGDSTFNVVFNDTKSNTKAYTEMGKISNSEYGRIYLKKDNVYGETLVFENRNHRTGLTEIDGAYTRYDNDIIINSTGGSVINSTGGRVLYKSGTDIFAIFDNNMTHITTSYGDGVINNMTVTANPKTVDSGSRVLYSLSEPLFLGSIQTIEFYGKYVDSGGKRCNGTEMVTTASTIDYLINADKDGGGADLTSKATVVTEFGSTQVKFTITSGSDSAGWITKANARGKGVYSYNPIDYIEDDSVSYKKYGYQNASLNQAFQTDLVLGTAIIQGIVNEDKEPKTKTVDVSFIANTSNFLMLSFLHLDIGSLIHLKSDRYNINGYFYIQKVEFTIGIGGIIMFRWKLKAVFSLLLGLSLVACQFAGGSGDALCFGNVQEIVDYNNFTWVASIYPESRTLSGVIASGWVNEAGGQQLAITTGSQLHWTEVHDPSGGTWKSDTTLPNDTWSDIAISGTRDSTGSPIMYVGGSAITNTNQQVASGGVNSLAGMDFCIGNIHGQSPDTDFFRPFSGKIKNVRIYNVILTPTEIADISLGSNITRGLIFQAPCVYTSELDDYDNLTLTSNTKVLDNVYGVIGTANGSPITSIP